MTTDFCLLLSRTTGHFCQHYCDKKEGGHTFPRHTLTFELPVSPSMAANPDKTKLKETIRVLRDMGWSYREIGCEVGLHWTRVGQIVKDGARKYSMLMAAGRDIRGEQGERSRDRGGSA